MIVKASRRNGACDFSTHCFKVRRCVLVDRDNDKTWYGQFINIEATAKPWFEQARCRILVNDAGAFDAGKAARDLARLSQSLFHVLPVDRSDLDRGFACDLALPGSSRARTSVTPPIVRQARNVMMAITMTSAVPVTLPSGTIGLGP